jgi:methylase of polypeptide subunit release factors
MNAELLGISNYKCIEADIEHDFIEKNNWPTKYDIIAFNPPWLPVKSNDRNLDAGVYDPKESCLKSGF